MKYRTPSGKVELWMAQQKHKVWSGHRGHLLGQVDLISHLSTHVWNSQGISSSSKLPG